HSPRVGVDRVCRRIERQRCISCRRKRGGDDLCGWQSEEYGNVSIKDYDGSGPRNKEKSLDFIDNIIIDKWFNGMRDFPDAQARGEEEWPTVDEVYPRCVPEHPCTNGSLSSWITSVRRGIPPSLKNMGIILLSTVELLRRMDMRTTHGGIWEPRYLGATVFGRQGIWAPRYLGFTVARYPVPEAYGSRMSNRSREDKNQAVPNVISAQLGARLKA
ncbi:hypothetical protein CALVIDRAFT_532081, partial [Calocera viscosa TUFC12733]